MPWISQRQWDQLIASVADKLLASVEDIRSRVINIQLREMTIMATLSQSLDDLEAQTKAIDGAQESAQAAFTRLADLIASLKTAQTDPATATRIQAAADDLRARAASLAAAVEASPQA